MAWIVFTGCWKATPLEWKFDKAELNWAYGRGEPESLKPGWRYEVRLDHAGSDPAYTGTPKPDYDYTLEFSPKPESVLLDDPQGL